MDEGPSPGAANSRVGRARRVLEREPAGGGRDRRGLPRPQRRHAAAPSLKRAQPSFQRHAASLNLTDLSQQLLDHVADLALPQQPRFALISLVILT